MTASIGEGASIGPFMDKLFKTYSVELSKWEMIDLHIPGENLLQIQLMGVEKTGDWKKSWTVKYWRIGQCITRNGLKQPDIEFRFMQVSDLWFAIEKIDTLGTVIFRIYEKSDDGFSRQSRIFPKNLKGVKGLLRKWCKSMRDVGFLEPAMAVMTLHKPMKLEDGCWEEDDHEDL